MIKEINIKKEKDQIVDVSTKKVLAIEECCPVCHETYGETDLLMRTSCDHHFHKSCLVQWFWDNQNCPLCRSTLIHERPKSKNLTVRSIFLERHPLMVKYTFSLWVMFATISLIMVVFLYIVLQQWTVLEHYNVSIEGYGALQIHHICERSAIWCEKQIVDASMMGSVSELKDACPSGTFECVVPRDRLLLHYVLFRASMHSIVGNMLVTIMFLFPVNQLGLIATSVLLFLFSPKKRNASFIWIAFVSYAAIGAWISHCLYTSVLF